MAVDDVAVRGPGSSPGGATVQSKRRRSPSLERHLLSPSEEPEILSRSDSRAVTPSQAGSADEPTMPLPPEMLSVLELLTPSHDEVGKQVQSPQYDEDGGDGHWEAGW
ncbi:hypothetical protein AURDEDRAFT_177958 [Auricularia subglabra TFB-10046 SS5]|uniref:Uncharacterized protein n=1 Tax=Auricularia subglabra (strain TFB-10046 / SS5) TaxID=717982 RepID=J0CRV1_AURST|nr:hypothetical protein AURDEDRAFT_177958 [Auricularia subglabra TFB-10046 SS5]